MRRSLTALVMLAATSIAGCHARSSTPDAGTGGAPSATASAFDGSNQDALTRSAARIFDDEAPEISAAVVGSLTIQVSARGTDTHDLRVSLDRIWVVCQGNPSGCEAATRDFVTKSVRTLRTRGAPATREQVVAVLRPRAYVDRVGGPSAPDTLVQPLVDDLFVVYMVDLPDSMRSLAPGELGALGLDRGSLPPVALANLGRRLGHLADALGAGKPGDMTILRSGNVFESSRLLMGDDWATLSARIGKPVYAAVPSGDVLLVAIGPSPDQLARMRDTARAMFSGAPRPVSARVFRWDAQAWVVVP